MRLSLANGHTLWFHGGNLHIPLKELPRTAMPSPERKRTTMHPHRERMLARLEAAIGYRFKDRRLLAEALTHTSYVHASRRRNGCDNQRMAFLGDSLLTFMVSKRLMENYPEDSEGNLSRMRASLVDTTALARLAEQLHLGALLLLSRGEEKIGGRTKKSVLAEAFEALAAAVCLDGGISCAERFANRLYGSLLTREGMDGEARDYKT
ncbi:hypothetical protein FDZ71_18605, partial [bacterium]